MIRTWQRYPRQFVDPVRQKQVNRILSAIFRWENKGKISTVHAVNYDGGSGGRFLIVLVLTLGTRQK